MSKPKNARIEVVGVVNVFRDGYSNEHLTASFKNDTIERYYYPCPKCFDDLIVDGTKNCVKVKMTVNEDGSNPRKVIKIGDPY